MHCVILADLAATLSQHGASLVAAAPEVPAKTVMRYWVASRTRHEQWHRLMGRYRDFERQGNFQAMGDWWTEHRVLLEEILVSDLLSRVVAALANESFVQHSNEQNESLSAISHAVFLSQIEATTRVGKIVLAGGGARVHDTVRLNRLRFGVERWSDWLIGRINARLGGEIHYCVDQERAQAFRDEIRENACDVANDTMTWLMNAAMREMLIRRTSEETALPDENYQVASTAMALFRPELFDDYGVPKSLWLQRLQRCAENKEPIDALLTSPVRR